MKNFSENWIYILLGFLVLGIIGAAVFAFSSPKKSPEPVSNEDLVNGSTWILGSKDARVVIVEFADFQCSACGQVHPTVKQIVQIYRDKIYFVYRHFPLISIHENALKASEASEAAGEQSKFWEYHNLLYTNQDKLKTENLKEYAKSLNLDMDRFNQALDSGKYKDKVLADLDLGEKFAISGTPTFFINGTKYTGVMSFSDFQKIIDSELAK